MRGLELLIVEFPTDTVDIEMLFLGYVLSSVVCVGCDKLLLCSKRCHWESKWHNSAVSRIRETVTTNNQTHCNQGAQSAHNKQKRTQVTHCKNDSDGEVNKTLFSNVSYLPLKVG